MNNLGKELLFISVIAIASFLCSFHPYFYSGAVEAINPLQGEKIVKVSNIDAESLDSFKESDRVFQGGFCYPSEDGLNHSDFYQGQISAIPTSPYWKMPSTDIQSSLVLEKIDKGFSARLSVPFDLCLPVFSLISAPEDIFGYEKGIYVPGFASDFVSSKEFYPMAWNKPANYYLKGNDQRKSFFSYYNDKGDFQFSSYIQLQINGKATRSFAQKSLRMEVDGKSKKEGFVYDFFQDQKSYESLVLRNGGNDNTKSLFRDMLMQSLMGETGVLTSSFLPGELFLNGEYWGIHILQNKLDDDFIAQKMGCKKKHITIVENWLLEKGNEIEFQSLMKTIKQVNKVSFEELKEVFSLDDLVKYLAGEIYFANTDWPSNNLKMYKVSGSKKQDTQWKFAFFDLDYGFGYTGSEAVQSDMFDYLLKRKDAFSLLFQRLMKEEEFKKMLKAEFIHLLQKNYEKKHVLSLINQLEKQFSGAIDRHTQRWSKPSDMQQWKSEVELLREFANQRNEIIQKQLKIYLP